MASERRTEVKTKAATGPPVIAGGYEVPAKAVFVRRQRTEVVTRDMLVFPYGEGFFYLVCYGKFCKFPYFVKGLYKT